MDDAQRAVADGITQVWSYGNIAVTVLFLCLIGSAVMNFVMYRDGRKSQEQSATAMLAVRDMIGKIETALALINERIRS